MFCKNCGKEIVDGAKFCENCGTTVEADPIQTVRADETPREQSVTDPVQTQNVTQSIQTNQVPETVQENGKNNHVRFKDLPPKQKKKRVIIGVICLLIALILIVSDCIGAAEKAEDKNEHIIETGNDDVFGGVSFDLTLEEFVETFNRCAENDTEYESVAELNKININNFVDIDSGSESLSAYLYNFGYSKGSNPYSDFKVLSNLVLIVNDDTGKIQGLRYAWEKGDYNSDQAKKNYYYKLPAKIFSIIYSEIDYPYGGDYSDYYNFLSSLLDSGEPYKFTDNMMYGMFDTGADNLYAIQFTATTKDSEYYSING